MLQFITKESSRFSVAEQAQMAIEGGCRWVQLSSQGLGDNEVTMRDVAQELIPLCKEKESFLVIENDVDLVDELKVHGVFLHDNSRATVMAARERLGAHAVIGVLATSVADAIALKGVDVDYVAVAVPAEETSAVEFYAGFLAGMREAEVDFHLVALGEFGVEQVKGLLDAGCAGIAVSAAIADAENPVEATSMLIEALDKARFGDDADADSVTI